MSKVENPAATTLAFSIRALSLATSISRSLIYQHIKLGLLKTRKVNKRTIVLREDAEEWLRSLK
jgi:predicted DNA-binding transcriptional regulator AlpA